MRASAAANTTTPQEVSELLMRLTAIGKTQVNKVDAGE
jgi:hypothetical protein